MKRNESERGQKDYSGALVCSYIINNNAITRQQIGNQNHRNQNTERYVGEQQMANKKEPRRPCVRINIYLNAIFMVVLNVVPSKMFGFGNVRENEIRLIFIHVRNRQPTKRQMSIAKHHKQNIFTTIYPADFRRRRRRQRWQFLRSQLFSFLLASPDRFHNSIIFLFFPFLSFPVPSVRPIGTFNVFDLLVGHCCYSLRRCKIHICIFAPKEK